MKKSLILFLFSILILNIFVVLLIQAQTPIPVLPELSGDIDSRTGLPSELQRFKEIGKNLSEEESRKAYLKQEWTKLMADKKVVGPFLFYTNKGFSALNPFWKIIFGTEFEWSWQFIFYFLFWIAIIIIIHSPVKSFLDLNLILVLFASIIIASLVGISGAIVQVVNLLTFFIPNGFSVLITILILFLFLFYYKKIIKQYGVKFKEKSQKAQKEKDIEDIHIHAKISRMKMGRP